MAETILSEAGMKSLEETMVILNELDIVQQNEFVLSIVKTITKSRIANFENLKKQYGLDLDHYEKNNEALFVGLETTIKESLNEKTNAIT